MRKGFVPGVYTSREECKKQTDGFKGNLYKTFKTRREAVAYLKQDERTLGITPEQTIYCVPAKNMTRENFYFVSVLTGEGVDLLARNSPVFGATTHLGENLAVGLSPEEAQINALTVALKIASNSDYKLIRVTQLVESQEENMLVPDYRKEFEQKGGIIEIIDQKDIPSDFHCYVHQCIYFGTL